jgi:hypothetical protein
MIHFTLRDLFWLTLVVALVFGWGVYSYRTSDSIERIAREREMYRRELRSLTVQLENEGYEITQSSIGPFLTKRSASP